MWGREMNPQTMQLSPGQDRPSGTFYDHYIRGRHAEGGIFKANAEGGIFKAYADGGITGAADTGTTFGAVQPYANGGIPRVSDGILTSPEIGLVDNDAIIPLTPKRRGRGIDLWKRTGQLLGAMPYANGAASTGAHLGLVAEDGAEVKISLDPAKRENSLNIWRRAGKLLGIFKYANGGVVSATDTGMPAISPQPYADDGILGAASASLQEHPGEYTPKWQGVRFGDNEGQEIAPLMPSITASVNGGPGGSSPVTVTFGDVNFDVNLDGATDTASIIKILKDNIKNLADEIAERIAIALEQVFANKPTAAREV
jgi:hypothetical protein